MSDCSTQAMEPKEPLLTNEILQGFADRIAVVVGMPESADCPCGLVDVYHAVQSLADREQQAEQRYQQLEQVAKEMMLEIDSMWPLKAKEYRQTIEALNTRYNEKPNKLYYEEVYEWAFSNMEGCDEPEYSMYLAICDAIARYKREVGPDD